LNGARVVDVGAQASALAALRVQLEGATLGAADGVSIVRDALEIASSVATFGAIAPESDPAAIETVLEEWAEPGALGPVGTPGAVVADGLVMTTGAGVRLRASGDGGFGSLSVAAGDTIVSALAAEPGLGRGLGGGLGGGLLAPGQATRISVVAGGRVLEDVTVVGGAVLVDHLDDTEIRSATAEAIAEAFRAGEEALEAAEAAAEAGAEEAVGAAESGLELGPVGAPEPTSGPGGGGGSDRGAGGGGLGDSLGAMAVGGLIAGGTALARDRLAKRAGEEGSEASGATAQPLFRFHVAAPVAVQASDGQVVGALQPGQWFAATDEQDGWVATTDPAGRAGWIPAASAIGRTADAPPSAPPAPQPVPPPVPVSYVVPPAGLPAWSAPDPDLAPVALLDPGLPVELIERHDSGWGLIRCSNGWIGWVDARLLAPGP
jgi:hypothetical protein